MPPIYVIQRPRITTGLFKGPREYQATHGGWILHRAPTKAGLKRLLTDAGLLSSPTRSSRHLLRKVSISSSAY